MGPFVDSSLPLWLKFLVETSKIGPGMTAAFVLYTRSAGVAYFAAGASFCSLSAKVIKRAVKQKRPIESIVFEQKKSYGMPSTHASACMFIAAYIQLACLYLPPHPTLPPSICSPQVVLSIVIPWASMIIFSRVWLKYHTWTQVGAGMAYGVVVGWIWFKLWYDDIWGIRTMGAMVETFGFGYRTQHNITLV